MQTRLTCILQAVPLQASRKWEFLCVLLLIGIFLFAGWVILRNLLKIRRAIKASSSYAPEVAEALRRQDWLTAISVSEKYIDSHIAVLVLAALRDREDHKDEVPQAFLLKSMNNAMQAQIMFLQHRHQDYLGLVQALAATAPILASIGGSSVTLSLAIVFAVPSVWFVYYLRKKNDQLEVEAKNSANEFMLFIEKSSTWK
jgi:biopolymer transport protein ExbB/TolQ